MACETDYAVLFPVIQNVTIHVIYCHKSINTFIVFQKGLEREFFVGPIVTLCSVRNSLCIVKMYTALMHGFGWSFIERKLSEHIY